METQKTLGEELKKARTTKNLSLREVEEVTEISNAYLSQLEHNKIKRPSANMLYKLANLYGIDFNHMLKVAGIIDLAAEDKETKRLISDKKGSTKARHSLAGYALSSENLTPEEEKELTKYLQYIRHTKNEK